MVCPMLPRGSPPRPSATNRDCPCVTRNAYNGSSGSAPGGCLVPWCRVIRAGLHAVRRAVLFLHSAGAAQWRADLRLAHAADLPLCHPVHAVVRLLAAGAGAGRAAVAASGLAAGATAEHGAD